MITGKRERRGDIHLNLLFIFNRARIGRWGDNEMSACMDGWMNGWMYKGNAGTTKRSQTKERWGIKEREEGMIDVFLGGGKQNTKTRRNRIKNQSLTGKKGTKREDPTRGIKRVEQGRNSIDWTRILEARKKDVCKAPRNLCGWMDDGVMDGWWKTKDERRNVNKKTMEAHAGPCMFDSCLISFLYYLVQSSLLNREKTVVWCNIAVVA